MQMALVLVLGSAWANAPAIKKLIVKLAGVPKKPVGAVAFVTVISAICCFINLLFHTIIFNTVIHILFYFLPIVHTIILPKKRMSE